MHVRILYLKISIEWCINKCIYKYIFLSDPPYTTAYNVTISSSLTPADLSGFDIMISWTVSDDSVMGCYIYVYSHCLVFMVIFYPQESVASYYHIAQNFGGRKFWRIATNKHFGGQNIGRLAAMHCKIARIKVIGR